MALARGRRTSARGEVQRRAPVGVARLARVERRRALAERGHRAGVAQRRRLQQPAPGGLVGRACSRARAWSDFAKQAPQASRRAPI